MEEAVYWGRHRDGELEWVRGGGEDKWGGRVKSNTFLGELFRTYIWSKYVLFKEGLCWKLRLHLVELEVIQLPLLYLWGTHHQTRINYAEQYTTYLYGRSAF